MSFVVGDGGGFILLGVMIFTMNVVTRGSACYSMVNGFLSTGGDRAVSHGLCARCRVSRFVHGAFARNRR